jgi:16S rRNA G966 N2-methylase RsmD
MSKPQSKVATSIQLPAPPALLRLPSLYGVPLPASRSGALYSAFSYPTKISPESIAVFIASHTKPGDTVLDTFGGSGSTGLATLLCANPTEEVLALAQKLGAPVTWGPREAVIYELSALGAFVGDVMCHPPDVYAFRAAAEHLIDECESELGSVYKARDDRGEQGTIRHVIWSDVLECGVCKARVTFWDAVVSESPLFISPTFTCLACDRDSDLDETPRVYETYYDSLTGQQSLRKVRVLKRLYGVTGKRNWARDANADDEAVLRAAEALPLPPCVPVEEIPWGDLYRSGYHKGITYAHHFYTPRNLLVMATLWEKIEKAPEALRPALRLLVLSYNATHATLMTRVVVKSGGKNFVLTGAQSGVLYISGLPVEKNIFRGLRRKAKTITAAFSSVEGSGSRVRVVHGSSTDLDLPDGSVDYVFTDPPFGDYIPYSELNFLNEVWLRKVTDREGEIIVSQAQGKTVEAYGSLMAQVFREIARTLKDNGMATVVFHSAKADVWLALQDAYRGAGLRVELSSVLDKLQGSFKQVTSTVTVKGDPLLLLAKGGPNPTPPEIELETDLVIAELVTRAADSPDHKERTPERLYSRFVARCLERGLSVPIDAVSFYEKAKPLLEAR